MRTTKRFAEFPDRAVLGHDVVEPGLEGAGRAEVVQRQPDGDDIGREHVVDEPLGEGSSRRLMRGAVLGREELRDEGVVVQVGDGVGGEVTVGDGAVRVGSEPALGVVRRQLAAARSFGAEGRVQMQKVCHRW